MSTDTPDESAAVEATENATPEQADDSQRIPLDRFRQVTSENKELRGQLDELSKWKEEQEQAALTELERERSAREKAEATAAENADKVIALERGAWIRNAAQTAGFADPDDAVAMIGLATADSEEAAAEQVKALAEKKPHLVAQGQAGPAPLSAPLASGNAVPVDGDGKPDPKAGLGLDLLSHVRSMRK